MSNNNDNKSIRRGIRNSYISSIVSITLVLFLLGIMGLVILNAKQLSDNIKENVGFNVFLTDSLTTAQTNLFAKSINAKKYVAECTLTSKDEAAKQFSKELGEDFVSFIGSNPLPASLTIKLKAEYLNHDKMLTIKKELEKMPEVQEIVFQDNLVDSINSNVKKVSLALLSFAGLLLFVSIVLINNTIRLTIYARRFTINTMKLVGATSGFIRKPFILRSIAHGLYSGIFAALLIAGAIFAALEEVREIVFLNDTQTIALLMLGIVILGIAINFICTYFAVNKFLRLNSEEINY